jgi:hypothetical protein
MRSDPLVAASPPIRTYTMAKFVSRLKPLGIAQKGANVCVIVLAGACRAGSKHGKE